jgi:hypothetical protein
MLQSRRLERQPQRSKSGELLMSIGTIVMIAALIGAILVLAIGMRPPPLYSDPETLPKREDANAEKAEKKE